METTNKQIDFLNCILGFLTNKPTDEQLQLIARLESFIRNSSANQLFVLKGYAGTGKTTILGAFIKALNQYKVKTRLLSPTGRAAKVLQNKSNLKAYTIHKQLYRRENSDDDFNRLQLNVNLHTNTVFIIDESSMISDYVIASDGNINSRNLLEDVIHYVFSGKNCKLIFLGDEGQLPPVGSDYSPALDIKHLTNNYSNVHIEEFCLSYIHRQSANSGILTNATILRTNESSLITQKLQEYDDIVRLNSIEFQESIEDSYSKYGIDDTLIVTYSNKLANRYNSEIRKRILWFDNVLCPGDLLMVVKNNYFWIDPQGPIGFIANGDKLTIKRIIKYEHLYGSDFARVEVKFSDYDEQEEMEVLLMLETLNCEGPSLGRDRIKELFFTIEQDYSHIKNKRKRYDSILKNPYFNALQIKYGYAITCHKSQGGQWSNVYVDAGYPAKNLMDSIYKRWLYTAVTRATKKVFLVNFPEDHFAEHTIYK